MKTDAARCIEPVRIDRDFFERQWGGMGEHQKGERGQQN